MLGKMVRKSLLHYVRITVWTLATLTTCGALVTMFTTISLDVEERMNRSLRRLGANAVVHREEKSPDWRAVETWAKAAGADVLVLRARIGTIEGKPLAVVSADPTALAQMTPYWVVSGARVPASGACLMGKRVANTLNIEVGARVTVHWTASQQTRPLRVVGVFESGDEDEGRIFTNELFSTSEADSAVTQPIVTYALLSAPGGARGLHQLAEQLRAAGAGVSVKPLRQILHGERTVLQKITLLSSLALAVVLVLSSLGVSAAMLARIVERRRELALLQALGALRRSVVVFLLYESATMGTVASVMGFVLGTILAQAVVQRVFHVWVTPHFEAFLAALAATGGVVLLAGVLAARRALHMEPALALRGE